MLPQGTIQDFALSTLPSRTLRLNPKEGRFEGRTEGLEAVKQAVYFILNTERYEWLIHSWDYGVELRDLVGRDRAYCIPEIERRVREALLQDDRITAVDNFTFTEEKNRVVAAFRVVSALGAFTTELGVRV